MGKQREFPFCFELQHKFIVTPAKIVFKDREEEALSVLRHFKQQQTAFFLLCACIGVRRPETRIKQRGFSAYFERGKGFYLKLLCPFAHARIPLLLQRFISPSARSPYRRRPFYQQFVLLVSALVVVVNVNGNAKKPRTNNTALVDNFYGVSAFRNLHIKGGDFGRLCGFLKDEKARHTVQTNLNARFITHNTRNKEMADHRPVGAFHRLKLKLHPRAVFFEEPHEGVVASTQVDDEGEFTSGEFSDKQSGLVWAIGVKQDNRRCCQKILEALLLCLIGTGFFEFPLRFLKAADESFYFLVIWSVGELRCGFFQLSEQGGDTVSRRGVEFFFHAPFCVKECALCFGKMEKSFSPPFKEPPVGTRLAQV